jgi:hypothetical protein
MSGDNRKHGSLDSFVVTVTKKVLITPSPSEQTESELDSLEVAHPIDVELEETKNTDY